MIGALVAAGILSGQAAPAQGLEDGAYLQRRRVMALVAAGDCSGAHGAVLVMADRPMFELVEAVCPIGVLEVLRWYDYNPEQSAGMMTDAQLRAARAVARGEDVEAIPSPDAEHEP